MKTKENLKKCKNIGIIKRKKLASDNRKLWELNKTERKREE